MWWVPPKKKQKETLLCLIVNIILIGSFFETGTWTEAAFYENIRSVFCSRTPKIVQTAYFFPGNGTPFAPCGGEERMKKANYRILLCKLANISICDGDQAKVPISSQIWYPEEVFRCIAAMLDKRYSAEDAILASQGMLSRIWWR